MKNKLVLLLAAAVFGTFSLQANSSFFVAPSFRGQVGTEYSGWENFTNAFNGPNFPQLAGSAGDGFITQTTGPVVGGPFDGFGSFLSGGNIYSFATTQTFTLTDSRAFPLGAVVFQLRNNDGSSPFDYDSVRLEYDNGGGPQSLFTSRTELNDTDGGIASSWNWDVSSLGINSYKIYFNASATSLSLDAAALDVQTVPEPSSFALLGLMLFGKRILRRKV